MKELKAFFKKDPFNLLVFILSIIILLIGTLVVNFLVGLVVFIAVNLIWVIPFIKWKKKIKTRDETKKSIKTIDSENDNLNEEAEKVSVALEERSDPIWVNCLGPTASGAWSTPGWTPPWPIGWAWPPPP